MFLAATLITVDNFLYCVWSVVTNIAHAQNSTVEGVAGHANNLEAPILTIMQLQYLANACVLIWTELCTLTVM